MAVEFSAGLIGASKAFDWLIDCPECDGLGFVGCRSVSISDPADDPGMMLCSTCIGEGFIEQKTPEESAEPSAGGVADGPRHDKP